MKRIVFLTLAIIVATMLVSAQQFIGVNLGYARPITQLNQPVVGQEKTLTPTPYNGFKVGLVYDATIVKGFGFSMGLNYTFGANTTPWEPVGKYPYPKTRSKSFYHQLEIPIDWQYKFEIAQKTWVILYSGPTLQCGLNFTQENFMNNGKEITLTNENKNNVFSENDMKDYALKRLNVTWGIGAGFQYERYFLRGGYDFGLVNPYKAYQFTKVVNDGNPRTRGRLDQWQVKLGIYLWKSNK